MRRSLHQCKEPHFVSFLIVLVLYIIALLAHFNVIHISPDIASWSWIIGLGWLLLAVRLKGI